MPSGRLEVISKEDCLALLRQAAIGRIAVSIGADPEIFPVNFCLIDDPPVGGARNPRSRREFGQRVVHGPHGPGTDMSESGCQRSFDICEEPGRR